MKTAIVAKAALFYENKLLLLTRSQDVTWRPGGLDLVGGKIDDDEDIYQGLVREIKEETGQVIEQKNLKLAYSITREVEGVSIVCLYSVGKINNDHIQLSPEHTDFSWHDLDEAIKTNDHPVHNAFLRHIRDNQLLAIGDPSKVQ